MAVIPVAAWAEPAKGYEVWVQGTQITEANKGDVLGDGKVKFDPANKTLTLTDATITGAAGHGGEWFTESSFGIESHDELRLQLAGKNKVSADNAERNSVGVYASGTLTILGDGSLTVMAGNAAQRHSFGIWAQESLIVQSGTIEAIGGKTAGENAWSVGMGSVDNKMIVQGGTITAIGDKMALTPNPTMENVKPVVTVNAEPKAEGAKAWDGSTALGDEASPYHYVKIENAASASTTEPDKPDDKAATLRTRLVIGSKEMEKAVGDKKEMVTMDVAPYLENDRTMLPVRFVAEALGFTVDWDQENQTAILKDDKTEVKIPIGVAKIVVNGKDYESDVPAVVKDDRTMLPIGNVARALGLKDGEDITWNQETKEVIIQRTVR